MAKRYAIWDKQSRIITPIFEVLSAKEWIDRYPVAGIDGMTVVCSAGVVNGGFFGILEQMVTMYEAQGADFTDATTAEEKLDVIEAWEDAQNTPSDESSPEERIAAALEMQNIMAMDTVNTDDPDVD